jgi:hypothetical protein
MGFNELNKYSSKLGSLSNEIKEKITTVYVCHRNGFTSVVVGFNDYETFVKRKNIYPMTKEGVMYTNIIFQENYFLKMKRNSVVTIFGQGLQML